MLIEWLRITLNESLKKTNSNMLKKGMEEVEIFIWNIRLDFFKPWTLNCTCTINKDIKS